MNPLSPLFYMCAAKTHVILFTSTVLLTCPGSPEVWSFQQSTCVESWTRNNHGPMVLALRPRFLTASSRGPIPIFSQADCHFHVSSENCVNSHHVLQSTDCRFSFHYYVHVLSENRVNVLQSIDCTS